jgi:hypothetical protein
MIILVRVQNEAPLAVLVREGTAPEGVMHLRAKRMAA